MNGSRIAIPLGLLFACAIAALTVLPRGYLAESLLSAQDDPGKLAEIALDRSFNATVAAREVSAALAADDPDLAQSFLDLARERKVPVDPDLAKEVEEANSSSANAARAAGNFARGFVTGEPDDLVGLAGTAVGDLFVFGDIRDAVREGTRFATGQKADELILGLACVGLAITAGTYASVGMGAPARIGLSVIKAARNGSPARCVTWSTGACCGARSPAPRSRSRRLPCALRARRSRLRRPRISRGWSAMWAGCRARPARRPRSMG
jgi:hypothetical protein